MKTRYEAKRKHDVDAAWVQQLIRDIQQNRWYGELSIVFENGQARRGRKNESLLPPDANVKP